MNPTVLTVGITPDIRIIRLLCDDVARLSHQKDQLRKSLFNMRSEVQRLEAMEKMNAEELAAALASRDGYAPKWEAILQKDHWNDY